MSISERILMQFCHPPAEDTGTPPADFDQALESLCHHFPDLYERLPGARVVDFGCGGGYQAVAAAHYGAATVLGLDINATALAHGRQLAVEAGLAKHVVFREAISDSDRGAYDLVICQDSIEHFRYPTTILAQMISLLRPGGSLLIAFCPTWYSPWGAHMNYFSRLPWVHLLFPESTVMRVRRQFRDDGARHYEDVEGGLNRMSVRRFERLVDASGCTIESLGYGCVMGINLVCKLPLMRELLVNTIFCELTDTVADA